MYGLAARAVRISGDGLTYRFLMRPEAKFHDGSRMTAHDVAFSLNLLKDKGHPIIVQLMRDVSGAEATDDATVVVRFAAGRGRDVPLFVASLPIFSRAYYSKRNFDETTLEVPLGSGPYKVGKFEVGRFIEYDRVQDWWGAELAGVGRAQQFRRPPLRVLSRSRRGVRRLHRPQLSVPRGIHLARLGDALQFSGDQGRPRQAGRASRRHAVRRAGLVLQHPPREVQEPDAARSADPGVRFRVDQQVDHVRVL